MNKQLFKNALKERYRSLRQDIDVTIKVKKKVLPKNPILKEMRLIASLAKLYRVDIEDINNG